MKNIIYDKTVLSPTETVLNFPNLDDFQRFVDETAVIATGNARRGFDRINKNTVQDIIRSYGTSKYGTKDADDVVKTKTSFLFNQQLKTYLERVRNQTVKVDIMDIDQKKEIQFTEKDIGIFSFDLASLGLIRIYEYYSPLLKKLVDADYVRGMELPDGKEIFYHTKVPFIPKHKVEFNFKLGGYYSKILGMVVEKKDLIEEVTNDDIVFYYPEHEEIPEHPVERKQKVDEEGNKVFGSTYKKCFIYTPRPERSLPRIDLIINASYSWGVAADTQMLWNSMAALAVAEKLSKANANYRILAAFPVKTSGSGTPAEVYTFITIKDENQSLDPNKMALIVSDGRFFRYELFRGYFASQYDAGFDSKINVDGIGIPITDTQKIKDAYMKYLAKQKGFGDREAAKRADSKIVFKQVYSEQQAINDYNDIIKQISKL
jgi:hypothetical protein